jgi:proline iminopeptidase
MFPFPAINPFETTKLAVSDGHAIYFEEYGNPQGMPVLFSHGGPGGGMPRHYARLFDPRLFRMIFWDQRGCGLSEPAGSLECNTTWDLLGDIEQLREHLQIERWIISGYSWGSTLSLLYAINHPKRVLALLVGGIFLGTRDELNWLFAGGAGAISPEPWQAFTNHIPQAERGDLIAAYERRINSHDPAVREKAIYHWGYWFGSLSPAIFSAQEAHRNALRSDLVNMAKIAQCYFANGMFLPDNYILDHLENIATIPGAIVHGRLDRNTRLVMAEKLHAAWPNSKLSVIETWGHWGTDQTMYAAIASEATRLRHLIESGGA